MYRFRAIPMRIPAYFFVEIDALVLKFIWNFQEPRRVQMVFKEEQHKTQNKTQNKTSQFQNWLPGNGNQDNVIGIGTNNEIELQVQK